MTPRLWRALVRLVAPPDERDHVLADLAEEARERSARDGGNSARRWYRRQVLLSLRPLAGRRLFLAAGAFSGVLSMRDLRSDVVYAFRRAIRRPLLPVLVVTTLALGLAAVASVFSVADAILFRPLPLPDSDRIVRVYTVLKDPGPVGSVNYLDLLDVASTSKTLRATAAFQTGSLTWRSDAAPEPVATVKVGERYLDVLGLAPQLGRWFVSSEFSTGANDVAVVTDSFWRRAFGGDRGVLNQTMDLDGRRIRIVGVLPATDFIFPAAAEVWLPLIIPRDSFLNNRQSVQLGALARVSPEATLQEAQSELATIDHQLQQTYPNQAGQRSLMFQQLSETLAGPVRPTLLLLIGAVLVVLLIAAANVADLLLSDAASRRQEFAVRAAIGAGKSRLGRQVIVETMGLVVTGGLLSLALTPALTAALVARYPTPLPRAHEIGLNGRSLAVAFAATALAGLFAAIPLVRASRGVDLSNGLRDGSRGVAGRQSRGLAAALVAAQVALSVMLLSAGVLLLRTFVTTVQSDLGFDSSGLLVFNVSTPADRYPGPAQQARFASDVSDRLSELPGVHAAGLTMFLPLAPGVWGDNITRVGTTDAPPKLPEVTVQIVTPTLPKALGLKITAGRAFAPTDTLTTPKVVMVNDALARRDFEGAPIGRRIVWQKETWEIIGTVSNVRQWSLVEPAPPQLYVPWTQFPLAFGWVVVRAEQPADLIPIVRGRMRELDATIPMTRVSTMDARLIDATGPERFRATLAGALGLAAVLLAILGLYGLLAHRVARQTREIGIRLALGEPAARVRRAVVVSALKLASAGVAVGIAGSLWSGAFIQSFLTTGLRAQDPWTLAAVSLTLLGVTAAAAWVPAMRASRTDPLTALRSE